MSSLEVSAQQLPNCTPFEKQVSVDGGMTWLDADDPGSAALFGGDSEYRFVITNCFTDKVCFDTRVRDDILGIDALVGDGIIDPTEQVIVTKDDAGFENLDPEECIPFNEATETTTRESGPGTVTEVFTDPAYVDCPPDIDIEKFTNGYDADDANGFPIPTPPNGGFVVGGNQVPLVEIGDPITWRYRVTNTGTERLVNVDVTDSKGIPVNCPKGTLEVGETFTCMGMGTALDLSMDGTSVAGCGAQGMGMTQPTYENFGIAVGTGETSGIEVTANDPSHYCNPPDVMIEKFTNGHDGDNPNGIPAAGPGSGNAGDATVAEVPSGDPILWTYEVTNNGDEALENVVVTDNRGVTVTCPQDTLAPGQSITCTATGLADDLVTTGGDVLGCSAFGEGDPRPTYENVGRVSATGSTSGVFVEDDDPSHYCNPEEPPECGLTVEKACALPPPPPAPVGQCDGKLQQFTVIWNGAVPITVGLGEGLTGASQSSVAPGDEVTFFTDGSTNDTIVNISGAVSGQSTFHVSCSDDDMDGDTSSNADQEQVSPIGRDCAKDQGDGKGKSGFINQWLLEGFVDKEGAVLDCTTDPEPGVSSCEFQAVAADCDFPNENPDNLTWVYTGGGCAASDNLQKPSGELFCTGSVDGGQAVTITDDKGNVFNVAPGGLFTTTRDASKVFTLSNAGGTETNGRHVSCSQPLQAGDVHGSLTLGALDGAGLGTDIIYSYLVTNGGPAPVTGITVVDDKLGLIGDIASLQPGESDTLTAMALISQTTTNVATVDGVGAPGAVCTADSNPVVVTVTPPPPCEASIAFKELKDDAIKWTLTNNATERKATMDTFTLVFPSDFGAIKEVKLDGAAFKAGDSATYPNGVLSGQTIGPDDWTHDEPVKRQLDQGESRTLEIKFMNNNQNASQGDFDLTVTFKEGCMVTF